MSREAMKTQIIGNYLTAKLLELLTLKHYGDMFLVERDCPIGGRLMDSSWIYFDDLNSLS